MQQGAFSEQSLAGELRKAALFTDLSEGQIATLCSIARVERYGRGEYLFRYGDPSDRIFLILNGKVRISRTIEGLGEEALAILGPGSYFGELSIVDDGPRSADAVAHESSVLAVFDCATLRDIMLFQKDLGYELLWNIARTLAARLRETNDKIILLSSCSRFE